jgi:NAD(P)-dependent dehydrogenase (short-subunit alcohol dehydrogenase family)
MVGSKDLAPSTKSFGSVFYNNQFRAKTQWPKPGTSLTSKTAIVTGGNTGLGYEACRQLLSLKLSRLILAVRSLDKGEAAAKKLREVYPKADIWVWKLDMSSYDSIQAFTKRAEEELDQIDYALLNAGIAKNAYDRVESTGHEETFQVNYLSTAFLTLLLLPVLKSKHASGAPAHLTIAGAALSLVAKLPKPDADPLFASFDDATIYNGRDMYNNSKLLMEAFLWNLVDYVSADDIIVNIADPAFTKGTELARDINSAALKVALNLFAATTARTLEVGTSCLVDGLVSKGKESHGCFLMSWEIHP